MHYYYYLFVGVVVFLDMNCWKSACALKFMFFGSFYYNGNVLDGWGASIYQYEAVKYPILKYPVSANMNQYDALYNAVSQVSASISLGNTQYRQYAPV